MDLNARRFRKQAQRENRGRRGVRRRYSVALKRQAVSYCIEREREGASLRGVAGELGVCAWSLYRWKASLSSREAFGVVELSAPGRSEARKDGLVVVSPEGYRVEGLVVASAAELLGMLR